MSYDKVGFDGFFLDVMKGLPSSLSSYNTNLRKADKALPDLDGYIELHDVETLIQWCQNQGPNLGPSASNIRSAVRAYCRFKTEGQAVIDEINVVASPEENAVTIFKYEAELQAAVRAQLGALEQGLEEDDDGYEELLETGRSDILARDAQGVAVVIELKAGKCPKGAIEQVLGYAQDRLESGEPAVRAFLIAGEFSARLRAAAKQIPSLELKTYRLAVQFDGIP